MPLSASGNNWHCHKVITERQWCTQDHFYKTKTTDLENNTQRRSYHNWTTARCNLSSKTGYRQHDWQDEEILTATIVTCVGTKIKAYTKLIWSQLAVDGVINERWCKRDDAYKTKTRGLQQRWHSRCRCHCAIRQTTQRAALARHARLTSPSATPSVLLSLSLSLSPASIPLQHVHLYRQLGVRTDPREYTRDTDTTPFRVELAKWLHFVLREVLVVAAVVIVAVGDCVSADFNSL